MRRIGILILLLLLVSVTMAQDDQQLIVEQYTLDNGLEVILVEDHSAPTVAVDIWYNVGGANDPDGRSGFAHLFEHMMFQGSANIEKGELDRLISAAGGIFNAYTDIDVTAYWDAVPSHQLPLALWLEADRLASLAVTQTNLDNQRAVVIEEYQLRVGNSPYGEAIEELFTLPHQYAPYQKRVIGSIEDLNAATVDEIREFHDTYYATNNATLVVAGDIDFELTKELIDQYFAPIPGKDDPPELPTFELTQQDEAEFITVEDPLANLPALLIGYETPPRSADDYAAVELLARILGEGDSSRLAVLLLDSGRALAAQTVVFSNRGPSLFGVFLLPNMGVELEEVEQIYYDELTNIAENGVDETELEKVINQIRSERIVGLESAFDLAESVQAANYYFGDPQAVFGEIDRFEDVTVDDIQRVVNEYLAQEDRHVITVVPSEATTAEDPEPVIGEAGDDEPDFFYVLEQSAPPDPLPVTELTLPNITETTLDNGLDVIVVEQPSIPIISLDMFFPGGQAAEPDGLAGISDIAGFLLTRGTDTRSAQDIARTIEQVGGVTGGGAGRDSISVGIFALAEDTDLAFELLGDMVLNPIFPQEEIDVQIEASLTNLEFIFSDPGSLANRTFNRLIYAGHPYGNSVTEDSLNAITRDEVVAFYKAQNSPDRAFLVVAGDITADEAIALAEATFGEWEADDDAQAVEFPSLETPEERVVYLVDRPGSTQAEFILGNPGVYGNDDGRYELQVMNQILGGGFSSRLFQNIREEKGYTYGIGSGFSYPADQGIFLITAAVRNEVADLALQEILNEIERIQSEPVPTDELEDTREGMIGRFALALEGYQDFVDQLASFKLRGIPASDIGIYPERVAAVDQDAVLAAAQATILPENFLIVVVGDASVLEPALSEIVTVEVIEAE